MQDDWEAFAEENVQAVAEGAFLGDDDGDNDAVLDSWEDAFTDDDDGNGADGASKAAEPPARQKKKSIQQVVEERKAAELKRQQELAARKAAEEAEDPLTRRQRLEQLQLEADLANTVDLFGASSLNADTSDTAASASSNAPPPGDALWAAASLVAPVSKQDWDQSAKSLAASLTAWKAKPTVLVSFLETMLRDVLEPIDYMDIRKLSSTLATMANEKQQREKKSSKKGTSKKAQVKMSANEIDADIVNEDYGEYDDFM